MISSPVRDGRVNSSAAPSHLFCRCNSALAVSVDGTSEKALGQKSGRLAKVTSKPTSLKGHCT